MTACDQPGLMLLPEAPLYSLIGTDTLGFLNLPGEFPELFT